MARKKVGSKRRGRSLNKFVSTILSAGGAPLVGPEVVGNVKLWFRADSNIFTDLAATIPASDGELVRSTIDKSGNIATPLTAVGDTRRPILRTTAFGGEASLEFDGTSDQLTLAGANASELEFNGLTDPFSTFIVFHPISTNAGLLQKLGSGPGITGWNVEFGAQDLITRIQAAQTTDTIQVRTTGSSTINTDHIMIMSYDGSGAAAGVTMYVDSTTPRSLTIQIDNLVSTTISTENFHMASRGGTTFLTGEMAEYSIHDKEFSAADVDFLMNDYAGPRYGITIS